MNFRKWLNLQFLYCKRLLRKKSFVVLLCLVPLMVLGLRIISNQSNGIVSVILCMEDDDDEIASEIIDKLLDADSVIRYEYCDDIDEAIAMVESGTADAAWVFKENMDKLIRKYGAGKTSTVLADVYQVEDTTSLRLARETLFASVYDYITYSEYKNYIQKRFEDVTEEELRAYYDYYKQDDNIFEMHSLDGSEWRDTADYLNAPIRGLLAILVLLAGIAGTMYFRQDREQGVYDYLPAQLNWIYRISAQMISMLLIGAAATVSLFISGESVSIGKEIVLMLMLIAQCVVFCSLLDVIFRKLLIMGIITPFLILLTLVLCPVFFYVNVPIQIALPPYFYLKGIHDWNAVIYMGIYIAAGGAVCILIETIKNRFTMVGRV